VPKPLDVICDEWPPYQIRENNRVSGFSTKIIETVFERMGIAIGNINIYPWKRAITMLEKGNADALFSVNLTGSRTGFAFYPEETIILSPWIMWVREEDGFGFGSFDDLLGKKVGLVRGYSYTPELWNFVKKHCSYEEVSDDEMNFRKLNAGRVDIIPAELGNGLYIIKKLSLKKIVPLMKNPVKTDGLYIIFNKNNVKKSLVDRFSDELKKLKQESVYRYLYDEYFELDGRPSEIQINR
jgi:polar amino acid transport system substrate-binding protein